MHKMTEYRDRALSSGVGVMLPLVARVADRVHGFGHTFVGRTVTGLTGKGLEAGACLVAPAVDRLQRVVTTRVLGGNGTSLKDAVDGAVEDVLEDAARVTDELASGGPEAEAKVEAEDIPTIKGSAPAVQTASGTPVPGAAAPESAEDLPIAGYTQLDVDEILPRLESLTQTDLAAISAYEQEAGNRHEIVSAIDSLLVDLPLPTYDSLELPAILIRLEQMTPDELRLTYDYEAATTNRLPILDKIETLLPAEVSEEDEAHI